MLPRGGGICAIDYDIIVGGQDWWDVSILKIEQELKNGQLIVTATFLNGGSPSN
jgi:hypothetical protein